MSTDNSTAKGILATKLCQNLSKAFDMRSAQPVRLVVLGLGVGGGV